MSELLNKLFNMGGYGIYVWPAYGITLLVLGMNVVITLNEKRKIKKMLQQQLSENSAL